MQLEFHQLDRRWEHLRVREPHRQRRLLASLADGGQQTPIVVVAAAMPDRYLVIDGHKRVAALEQLGRDTVEATVWAMSEAEAVLLSRSLRFSPRESALEQGWLLAEMEQRFGYGWRSWRAASTAASVGCRGGWRWWSCCRKRSSSKCAKERSRRKWP